jgi:uncharacterized secreted protein with C-terminal beta-propeller domain
MLLWVFLTFVVTTLVVGGGGYYFWSQSREGAGPVDVGGGLNKAPDEPGPIEVAPKTQDGEVAKFNDVNDFKDWLKKAGTEESGYGYYGSPMMLRSDMMVEESIGLAAPTAMPKADGQAGSAPGGAPSEPGRYSETNVQVSGIDEPDIVKTDGKEIFYSPEQRYWWGWERPMPAPMIKADPVEGVSIDENVKMMPPQRQPVGVRSIKAFPPADLKIDSQLELSGDLLLSGKTLIVQIYEGLYGYDVSDPTKPAEKWKMTLLNSNQVIASRLYKDKIYLVTRARINDLNPCPVMPLKVGDNSVSIPCGMVYHPVVPTPTDVTYSVMKVDAASGQVEQSVSFVGSTNSSAIYMSEKNLFVTNIYRGDMIGFFVGFLKANSDLAPAGTVERLEKLSGYDISAQAKEVELMQILQSWQGSLNQDEQLKLENEMANRMDTYMKEHVRDMEKTGVVRIAVDNLSVTGNGVVPGHLLNQFSMDEYDSYLRLATTSGGRGSFGWQFGINTSDDSVNDVYTLDSDMNLAGSAKDMGKGERIYSVRFIQDKGYVVTFKETDPLYVLDLSDARNPQIKGELKIPGYSSYLHPINKDKILGFGKEDNQVKVSLFDVSDPSNPIEKAKYTLKEYWSDILNTHHAFLLDSTHEAFFVPGSSGGYVFLYSGDNLKMATAVSDIQAKRAVYISDYMYILGENKVVVLNEKDWQKVNQLDIPGYGY